MARYTTTIDSSLSPGEAFAYLADFSNARSWDPSVLEATRASELPTGEGATFDLVVKFGGRSLPMEYRIVSYDEPRVVVLESRKTRFTSRDTITVARPATDRPCTTMRRSTSRGSRECSIRPCSSSSTARATKPQRGMRAALNPMSCTRPRRRARGERRRQLHPHRLRRAAAALRLDAARAAAARRQDGDRHRRDLGARPRGGGAARPPGRARLHRRPEPGANRARRRRDRRLRVGSRRPLVTRRDPRLRRAILEQARPARRPRAERRRDDTRFHRDPRATRSRSRPRCSRSSC